MKICTVFWRRLFLIFLKTKPTYLMGVGTPANILEAVDRGVDFFSTAYTRAETGGTGMFIQIMEK